MGWWWTTGAPKQPAVATQIDLTDHSLPDQPAQSTSPIESFPESSFAEPPKRALTREEQSNEELASWLQEIQSELEDNRYSKPTKVLSAHSPAPDVPDDISPDSLYPTEISCRSAFDYAFFCQSFGGQFVNVYRYGGFRSCSNHWQDFWLCMRTRKWVDKDRHKAIQDHYRKKAIKYKTGPSSDDVWRVRTEPVRDAFQGNLEELERQIEQWKKENPGITGPWGKSI